MAQTYPEMYSFRVNSNDLELFRKLTRRGVTPAKTATADTLRAFIKAYNANPYRANQMIQEYLK